MSARTSLGRSAPSLATSHLEEKRPPIRQGREAIKKRNLLKGNETRQALVQRVGIHAPPSPMAADGGIENARKNFDCMRGTRRNDRLDSLRPGSVRAGFDLRSPFHLS